jgi:hypothetical protein
VQNAIKPAAVEASRRTGGAVPTFPMSSRPWAVAFRPTAKPDLSLSSIAVAPPALVESPKRVRWVDVVDLARSMEGSAKAGGVAPEDGAQLVLLLLQFARGLVGGGMRPTPVQPSIGADPTR